MGKARKVNYGVVAGIAVLVLLGWLVVSNYSSSGDLAGEAYTGVSPGNTPLISYSFDSLSGDRFIDEGTLGHDAVCQDTGYGCPVPVEDVESGGASYNSPSLWDFTQFYRSLLRVPRTDFGDRFTIAFRASFDRYTNGYILSNDMNNAGGISVKIRGTSDITGAIEVLTTGNAGQITGAPVNEAPGFEGTVARTGDNAVAIGDYNGRVMISDVAIVVDRAAGTARIYVNGVDKTVESAVATTFTTDNEWVIGGSPANSEYFNGYLDDLRIYPNALTGEEVLCLAHADKLSCGDSTDANSNGYPDHHDLAVIRRLGTMDQLSAFVRYVHRYYDITGPIYVGGYGGTPDGRFTSHDTHAVGREQCDTASCDFNNDGVFNTVDVEQINEMYVGLYDLNGDRIASGFEPYGFSGEYDANYAVSILEGRAPCIFDTGGSRGQITGAPVYEPDPVAISPGIVYCDVTGDAVFDWNDHDAIANGESFVVPQEPVCGDSIVESTEQCDDGNTDNTDTCSSTCNPVVSVSFDEPPGEQATIKLYYLDVDTGTVSPSYSDETEIMIRALSRYLPDVPEYVSMQLSYTSAVNNRKITVKKNFNDVTIEDCESDATSVKGDGVQQYGFRLAQTHELNYPDLTLCIPLQGAHSGKVFKMGLLNHEVGSARLSYAVMTR